MNPIELLNGLEKLFKNAIVYGVTVLIISSTYWLLFWIGLLPPTEFYIEALKWARLAAAVSLGVIAVGIATWLVRLIIAISRGLLKLVLRPFVKRKNRKRALEDIYLLPAEARLLLYGLTLHPAGRFTSPGENGPLDSAFDRRLILREEAYLFRTMPRGALMKVSSAVMEPVVIQTLRRWVQSDYPTATSDEHLAMEAEVVLKRYY